MTKLPKPATGNAGIVRWCNQLRECVRERTILVADGSLDLDKTVNGYLLHGKRDPKSFGSAVAIKAFWISPLASSSGDFLYCNPITDWDVPNFNGTSQTFVKVAKPYNFRTDTLKNSIDTLHSAYTFTGVESRNQTGILGTEEIIYPGYFACGIDDAVIIAAKPSNGTGIDGVDWIDLNAGGRIWTAPVQVLDICDNGTPKKMRVRGGAPYLA